MRTSDLFHLSTRCIFTCQSVGNAEQDWNALVTKHGVFYKSESGSEYVVDGDIVYRMSNHWGHVGSCDWALEDPKQVSGELATTGNPMLLISHRITDKRVMAIGMARLEDFKLAKRFL
jgi:hypothetical protein